MVIAIQLVLGSTHIYSCWQLIFCSVLVSFMPPQISELSSYGFKWKISSLICCVLLKVKTPSSLACDIHQTQLHRSGGCVSLLFMSLVWF